MPCPLVLKNVYLFGKQSYQTGPIMEVTFETKKLEQICVSQDKLRAEFGPRMSQVIMRRLLDLAAADNLEVMRLLPGRCHELTENLKGMLALDLVHPDRLVFKPGHHPRPQLAAGGLDWGNVTHVIIIGIGNDHG